MLRGREGMGAGQRAGDPTLWGGYRERELGLAPGDTSAPACTPDLPHGNGLPLTEIDFSPHLQPVEGGKEEFLLCLLGAAAAPGARRGRAEEGGPDWRLDKGQRPWSPVASASGPPGKGPVPSGHWAQAMLFGGRLGRHQLCPGGLSRKYPTPPCGHRQGLNRELGPLGSGATLHLDGVCPNSGRGMIWICSSGALRGHGLREVGTWGGAGEGAERRPSRVLRPILDNPPAPHQAGQTRSRQAHGRAA